MGLFFRKAVASVIFIFCLGGSSVNAEHLLNGVFTGYLTNAKTQAPLIGATVYISDIKVGASTNVSGFFEIKNVPEGKHLVEISHVGFATIVVYVQVEGTTRKDFALTEAIVENNAVIVTGVTGATQLKRAPFQVSVMRKQDILQSSSTNIIEALAKKPGVSSVSTGPAISKPVIRGLGYNRVLTINDGVRQEGQQWGDEHGIEIDESSVNKVEILKGPASIIYGSDALAGVINIITNVPVENNTIKANVLANYQSNNRARTIHASVAGNSNGFNWNLYGSGVAAADYQNAFDGKVFNSKFTQRNLGGYAGYNGNWGYSHILFSNFDMKAGLVEGDRDELGYFIKATPGGGETRATTEDFNSVEPGIPFQHIRHFKVATDNSFKFGQKRLAVNVGFQRNQREEFGNVDNLNERSLYFDLSTITYTTQLHFKEMNGWSTSAGLNGMYQQNVNKGVEQLVPDYDGFDAGAYLYSSKTMEHVTFSGGARFDNRNLAVNDLMEGTAVKGEGFEKSFRNVSASVGAAFAPSRLVNIKLNLARAFRAPSIPELASNGAHEGTTRYEYGDRDLKSEISTQADLGLDFNAEHISFGVSVYRNDFNNFIFYRKLQTDAGTDSLVNVGGDELEAFKFDQRKAVLSGLEATVDIHPHPLDWLHIQNTFSLVSGRFKEAVEGSKNIPFIPAPRLITEVRSDFKNIGASLKNGYIKLEMDNTFAQQNIFTAYNTETETPGYTLVNAAVGADIVSKKGNTIFSVNFIATNLGDVAYQHHLNRLKYAAENLATGRRGVFNMGRNFTLKVNVPLIFKLGGDK